MKKFLSFILTMICVSSMAQITIINDKNAQVRNVGTFNSIKVSGAIEVLLSQSNEEAVAVSASEEKFRDKIKTEVVNGTLKIFYDGDKLSWNIGNKKLRAYVSFKNLTNLEASGASTVKINGTLNTSGLNVKLSGACELSGSIKATDVKIDVNGASNVKLNGSVASINIDASGASDVKGYDLSTDECIVNASGASDINITVNKEISAHASGASSIHYKGNGIIKNVRTSGASSVSKRS
ncbi:MAG: DUF2807 domain-containing protein [Chitinophagaceae bacterium]|nr:DUF2807 domain-containing protein [Chitinophagaceae bacterium]